MGNCLSRDELKAIEVVERLLDRTSLQEIASHPVVSHVHGLFTRATAEDRDLLLEAIGLPSCPRLNVQAKSDGGNRSHHVRRAIEGINKAVQDPSFTSTLESWRRDASSFWRIEAQTFLEHGSHEVECIRTVYNGLHRVEQDDQVNGVRYRFLLVMLRHLRDRVAPIAALCEKGSRGQSYVSKATIRIARAISNTDDQNSPAFISIHHRLKALNKSGNKYVTTTGILGAGILFLLGGMRECSLIQLEDINLLKRDLEQRADIIAIINSLTDLAKEIICTGLRECGWTAFETAEREKGSIQSRCWQAATSEDYFDVCTRDLVGKSRKGRCDDATENLQGQSQILSTAVKRSRHERTGSHPIPIDSDSSGPTTKPSIPANALSTRKRDSGADLVQFHAPVSHKATSSTLGDHTACQLPDMVMTANYLPTPGIHEDSPSANLPNMPTPSQHPVAASSTPVTSITALPSEQAQSYGQADEFSMFYTASEEYPTNFTYSDPPPPMNPSIEQAGEFSTLYTASIPLSAMDSPIKWAEEYSTNFTYPNLPPPMNPPIEQAEEFSRWYTSYTHGTDAHHDHSIL